MSIDAEMKAALITFTIESLELLQDMEDSLLSLEDGADPTERINSIFRAAHTIKGSSGLFGLDHIVKFTHVVESVLDAVREGKIDVSSDLVAVLLPCCDHIALLIRAVVDGDVEENPDMTTAGDALLAELRPFLEGNPSSPVATVAPTPDRVEASGGGEVETGNWHISLRFGEDSLRNGMDPLSFIRYLTTLGVIVNLTTITNRIPAVAEMDPETNYLGFEIDVKSDAGKEALENVFEFVRADSIIHILPLESAIADYIELIRSLPEDDAYLGELLVKSGVLTKRELEDGLSKQKSDSEASQPAQPIGEILVEQQVVQQPLVTAALEKQKQIKDNKARESQSIRVDAERLDKLIDLIGELVISSAGVNLRALQTTQTALLEATGEMMRLVEEVRDSALQLRMVPIGTTFSRFQRVVRDVSKELGKDINLVITGGDTEVDKSVVEKIGDPLMHLVRNAMDHGIEPAEVRLQNGKPSQGTLRLNAYHESGTIAIEVSDDGGGLNRERILAKAVEKGMVAADAKLTDQEVYALIFEPGFSTAAHISNLSGRGVGMDVVKRNVTDLRGSIEVDSTLGVGTTMRIRLPLTLAIIDGFLVGVGKSSFVIPLDRVVECVELTNDNGNNDYMDLRGEVLPFIRLRNLFCINDQPPRRANVVVVDVAGAKTGLVVDRLLGESQTVIKPLGKLFAHAQGLGGSTILGSGEVALILDVPVLVSSFEHKMQRHALSISA
ncbi:chemotaxis protein CheA [Methylomonas sp. SURF-1]|uniref:Chemotaxis protein CheA n=1 Tax=Methylomonas aurea TaxID=2952224 RepID=A0ABT1UMN9_9GAMM|nr:chemotaxis protein CheA [Methylomonas sp. SURF-1]MCQ8182959.1 chemotaxis protein CheA [Methylomonas sp. SURF-1]